jgi:alpha-L-fucosidase
VTTKHPFRSGAQATTLYLHVFEWPASGVLRLEGISNEPTGTARVLGAPIRKPAARQEGGAIVIEGIGSAPTDGDCTVVAVDIAGVPAVEAFRVRPAADGSLACTAADAVVTGSIQYEDRFANLGWWRDLASTASWPIELPEERSFDATIEYAADSCCAGDISVSVMQDGKVFFPGLAQLQPRKGWGDFTTVPLGRFTVPAGRSEIIVKAATKNGDSFINLRRIDLKPVR